MANYAITFLLGLATALFAETVTGHRDAAKVARVLLPEIAINLATCRRMVEAIEQREDHRLIREHLTLFRTATYDQLSVDLGSLQPLMVHHISMAYARISMMRHLASLSPAKERASDDNLMEALLRDCRDILGHEREIFTEVGKYAFRPWWVPK